MIEGNELTGLIPTEIGLLTDLTTLDLSKHFIFIYVLCFETKSIIDSTLLIFPCGFISFYISIMIDWNDFIIGSIPTEVLSLTKLNELRLGKHSIFVFTFSILCS